MKIPVEKRHFVVGGLFVLSLILYIDRAAISSAKSAIAHDLALSDTAMGWVFGAFSLGYAFAQIPWGWFADHGGPRVALAIVVSLWSAFTSLTGTAHAVAWLLLVRFLFGVAEAGAFPGSARTFYNWLPPGERGLANGILFSGALLGGGLAFPLCQWLSMAHGWRIAFYLLGVPGFLWALSWLIWFRDYPDQNHSGRRRSHTHSAVASVSFLGHGESDGSILHRQLHLFYLHYLDVPLPGGPVFSDAFASRAIFDGPSAKRRSGQLDFWFLCRRALSFAIPPLVTTGARDFRFSSGSLRNLRRASCQEPRGGSGSFCCGHVWN
jgi:MFS family permease